MRRRMLSRAPAALPALLCLSALLCLGAAPPATDVSPPPTPEGLTSWACKAGPGIPITNGHLYTLDMETGAQVDLGLPASNGASLAWDPTSSRLLGLNHSGLWDLTTMPGTKIGSPAMAGVVTSLSRHPVSGKFYSTNYSALDCTIYEIDVPTGTAKFIGYGWGVSISSMAISPTGQAFGTDVANFRLLYSIDLVTGDITEVGPLNDGLSGSHTSALCFDAAGTLWLLSGGTTDQPSRLFTVNTSTGQATFVRFVQSSGWYTGLAIR